MENHNIDSIFKRAISESEDFYDSQSNKAKENIWSQVQSKKQNNLMPFLFRLLVAACILLFIWISVLSFSNYTARKKITTLVELNSALNNEIAINHKNEAFKTEQTIAADINLPDTVYIEKQVIVEKQIITTKQITDTVYIQQIVYIENKQTAESIFAIEDKPSTDSIFQRITEPYKTEILITNTELFKKEKRKKFQFKFGGNNDQQSSGTLAFSSKL